MRPLTIVFILVLAIPLFAEKQHKDYEEWPDDPKPGEGVESCTRRDFCKSCDAERDRCVSVTFSQYCSCANKPVPGAAAGITYCDLDGGCKFVNRFE